MQPTELERAVVDLLLGGDHPALVVLRRQWAEVVASNREMSGVGSFLTFKVPENAPRLTKKGRLSLGDVVVDLPGREAVAGAVLFVDNGVLDMLELFTFDGPWPEDTTGFKVRYTVVPRVLSQLEGG